MNGTSAAILDAVRPRPPSTHLRVLTLAECAAAPPRGYTVKGLLAPGDVGILFGPPGAGKSVVAPYIAHAVATGRRVFGRRTRKGAVIYAAAEDPAGLRQRATALRAAYGDAPGFFLIAQPLDLMTPDPEPMPDVGALLTPSDHDPTPRDAKALRHLAGLYGAAVIFLDTVAASFPGLQENESAAMDHVVRIARYLAAGGAAVVLIHHGTKAEGATPRGHGRLDGDADVTLRIEVPEDRSAPRVVKLGKNRNGSSMDGFAFTIRAETLGEDEDGDPITAPVLSEADPSEAGNKRAFLPAQPRRALGFLSDLILSAGNTLPDGAMFPPHPDLRCVPFEDWRGACAARTLSASAEKRAVNQAFQRAAEALSERGYIATAEHEGVKLVWLAKGAGT